MPKDGGLIRQAPVLFLPPDDPDGPPRATGSVNIANLPNGSYVAWAIHTVEKPNPMGGLPLDKQLVGCDPTTEVAVTQSQVPADTPKGTIAFGSGSPARQNGGTILTASGTYTLDPAYRFYQTQPIALGLIPTGGGVYRSGMASTVANGNWSNASAYVRSDLTYSAIAYMTIESINAMPRDSQLIGCKWVTGK